MNGASLKHEISDGRGIVRIIGEIDFSTTDSLRDNLDRLLQQITSDLIVDLTETTFLDSAGISLLYELCERLEIRNVRLRVVVPVDNLIRRTLELTDAQTSFPLYATTAEAEEQSSH